MEIQIGVAKINKYAVSESGDTLEVVERPNGGLSVVLADGQRSGKSAKRISNMVVRKVIALLAEGVRDGPAARAASDYLYSMRGGKVSSTLNILSVDLESNSIVITRNNPAPILVGHGTQVRALDEKSLPVGIYRSTRPVIDEINLEVGLTIVAFTDGLIHAGDRVGSRVKIDESLKDMLKEEYSAQAIADQFMNQALALDDRRPIDDISVVAIQVSTDNGDAVRRMTVRLPLS